MRQPIRLNVAALTVPFIVILTTGFVAAADDMDIHSPNVTDVENVPAKPRTGEDVTLRVTLANDTDVEAVRGVYCRVQRYACAPAIELQATSGGVHEGRVPWNARFFEAVREVGYRFEIKYQNGTNETSPRTDYPTRPTDLPEGADTYYFYTLEAAAGSPGTAPLLLILVLVGAAAWRNRP